MKILALRRSYSFQSDYNKLVQNEHLLLLGIRSTLYLLYSRPEWMSLPEDTQHQKKKKLKLSKSKKLTVLFFLPRICDWLQVIPCFQFSCSLECLPGWSKYMQEERQSASCANRSGWHSNFMGTYFSHCIFHYWYLKRQGKDIQALCKWEHWGHLWFQFTVSFACISTPK